MTPDGATRGAADNHLLFPGSGSSSAAEYEPAEQVDPAVVGDIVGWLEDGSRVPADLRRPG